MSIQANLAKATLSVLAIIMVSCGPSEPAPTEPAAVATNENATATASAGNLGPKATATIAAATAAKPATTRDPIRGKDGLEERCLKEVARQGTTVIGTNRIEESQAAIEIYVNVVDGQAPWRCRGSRDGKIESVEYSGSEGEL